MAEFQAGATSDSDIPAQLRRADPNLKFQPSVDMISPDGRITIRVGPYSIAYSRRGGYPGWNIFAPELEGVVDQLYRLVPYANVSRLGLRYINALKSDEHGVKSIDDIGVKVKVAEENLSNSLNLNFKSNAGTNLETMSRIASADLAQGSVPQNATVIVDIDVYTGSSFSTTDAAAVKAWVREAHDNEKESFFKVLGKEATERLREE